MLSNKISETTKTETVFVWIVVKLMATLGEPALQTLHWAIYKIT